LVLERVGAHVLEFVPILGRPKMGCGGGGHVILAFADFRAQLQHGANRGSRRMRPT
jgi:hypothetical protein